MTGNKYDFCIINLKVIAQTPRNRRLRMTSKNYFTLEDDHVFVPMKRLLFGDGREKLIRDINFLLNEIMSQTKILLSSRHFQEDSDTDERRTVLNQLVTIYRELERSIAGFENLKCTYESDKLIVGELDFIIDKIRTHMQEIELKLPSVVENISPVLVEKGE